MRRRSARGAPAGRPPSSLGRRRVLAGCNGAAAPACGAATSSRWCSPGAQVPGLVGAAPGAIVAFRWNTELRAVGAGAGAGRRAPRRVPHQAPQRHRHHRPQALAYSDPAPTPAPTRSTTFDTNDEIAFMADDTGGRAPRPAPATPPAWSPPPASGSRSPTRWPPATRSRGHRRRLRLPLRALRRRAVARRRRGLRRLRLRPRRPDRATPRTPRSRATGTPPTSPPAGHATTCALGAGPDILDRHRNLFAVGYCGRSEDTFSAGDGGYATNIDGPVRVIRSYLGRQQRHLHPARAHLLPEHRAGADVPPGARHPRDHGLLRLQPGRRRDAVLELVDARPASRSTASPTPPAPPRPPGRRSPGTQGAPRVVDHASQTDIAGPRRCRRYYRDDDDAAGRPVHRRRLRVRRQRHRHHQRHPEHRPDASAPSNNLTATRWNVYVPSPAAADVGRPGGEPGHARSPRPGGTVRAGRLTRARVRRRRRRP